MNISDIISSVLAGLTFLGIVVALGLGVWSIIETRNIQKKRFEENLYDDILNWLQDILGCEPSFNINTIEKAEKAFKSEHSTKSYRSIVAGNIANELMKLFNRGVVFRELSRNKRSVLSEELKELNSNLRTLSDIYSKYRGAFNDAPRDFVELEKLLKKQSSETKIIRKRMRQNAENIAKLVIEQRTIKSML